MSALPTLPAMPSPEELARLDDGNLAEVVEVLRSAERATLAAMSPYNRHLAEVRARLAELATEQRRRERAAHVRRRASVRDAARAGEMPSLDVALDAADVPLDAGATLQSLRFFLKSGGEVGVGFATRPGVLTFTDGRRQQLARTWGDARRLHEAGWEPGTPGIPGVRVHLAGSRVERVVPAADVVLEIQREEPRAAGTPAASG